MIRLNAAALIAAAALLMLPLDGTASEPESPEVNLSDGLTLDEAVTLALSENPRIRLAESGEAMALAKLRQAQSTWLPELQVSETFTRGDNPVYVFGTLLEQGRFSEEHFDPAFLNNPPELDNYRLAITARYPIFDQLRRWSTISQAGVGLEQARLQADAARQTLREYAIRAYYGVLVAKARAAVADGAVEVANSNAKIIRDRFETGLVVQSDLLAAEVQASEYLQQLIQANGQAEIARKMLENVTGLPSGTQFEISGELVPTAYPDRPWTELLADGMENRQDLKIAELDQRGAALGSRTAKGQFLPRIDTFATWGQSGETTSNQNDDMVWGVSASFNVLDPGRIFRVSEARAAELAAAASVDDARSSAELAILTAYQKYLSAKQRLDVGERSVAQATDARRIVSDRYQEGLTPVTEMLRAQNAELAAKLMRFNAIYELHAGYAELLRATGRLDSIDPFLTVQAYAPATGTAALSTKSSE